MTKLEARARDNSYSQQYRNRVEAINTNKDKKKKRKGEKGVSENKLPDLLATLKALTGFDPEKNK